MMLCLPLLMFQGRAQEALDHYLETFPEAELLEVMHHPEGTEIVDPAGRTSAASEENPIEPSANLGDEDAAEPADRPESAADHAPGHRADDTAALETVVDWENTLVATAQLRIGGQLLMIQDSLSKRDFDFTPSISMAVVVDTADEFTRITQRLAAEGEYLMAPGEYDFAANFAWVKDRFGVTWQINQTATPDRGQDQDADSGLSQAGSSGAS